MKTVLLERFIIINSIHFDFLGNLKFDRSSKVKLKNFFETLDISVLSEYKIWNFENLTTQNAPFTFIYSTITWYLILNISKSLANFWNTFKVSPNFQETF